MAGEDEVAAFIRSSRELIEMAEAQARSSRRRAWFWFICFAAAMSGALK